MGRKRNDIGDNINEPSREATNLEVVAVSKNLQAGRSVDDKRGYEEAKKELGIK